jgi:hypothetical protein
VAKTLVVSVAGMLSMLAAIEVVAPDPPGTAAPGHAFRIASFIPACEPVPPHVESVYTSASHPPPRGRFAAVEVFMHGHGPTLHYQVVGEVTISTNSRNVSLWNLIDSAKAEARHMGGTALIDVWPRPISPDDPQGGRVLTAKVVNWS